MGRLENELDARHARQEQVIPQSSTELPLQKRDGTAVDLSPRNREALTARLNTLKESSDARGWRQYSPLSGKR